jgi:UDP-GlcNAc:undecaprenyl-phosphate/decaprenyl-phosphate GlcNAc-1-phosphate transferase
MINNFLEILSLLMYPLFGLLISFLIISFYWGKIFIIFNLKAYESVQRVHEDEVPRLGGLFTYIFLLYVAMFELIEQKFIFNIIISAIPFILISIKEDLFHNTIPRNRLIFMTLSCLIFFNLNPIEFPVIELPYLGNVLSFYPVSLIFFTFSVLVVMNGTNLIDGMNGLFGFSSLTQLIILGFLAYGYGDYEYLRLITIITIPLFVFLIFNFPFGKVFIGDCGCYFYGFVISLTTIAFFGKHTDLISWLAVLIVIHPSFEVLFSFCRKMFYSNIRVSDPDSYHIHNLQYKLNLKCNSVNPNSYATVKLAYLFILPLISSLLFSKNLYMIIFSIFFYIICYVIHYAYLNARVN